MLGEATYRLGRMFAEGTPSIGNCLGALVFSPVATLNRTPVCRRVNGQPTDDFGLPTRTWHKVAFGLGQAYISFDWRNRSSPPWTSGSSLRSSTTAVPTAGQRLSSVSPGRLDRVLGREPHQFHVGFAASRFTPKATWWGRYFRDYAAGRRDGASPDRRLGVDARARQHVRLRRPRHQLEWDRVVTAGLAGPMLEYASRHGELTARARSPRSTASRW